MNQIRIGLENKLDISWYAKPDFDWMQMKAIREGLEEDLNVSEYADPTIHRFKMHFINVSVLPYPP